MLGKLLHKKCIDEHRDRYLAHNSDSNLIKKISNIATIASVALVALAYTYHYGIKPKQEQRRAEVEYEQRQEQLPKTPSIFNPSMQSVYPLQLINLENSATNSNMPFADNFDYKVSIAPTNSKTLEMKTNAPASIPYTNAPAPAKIPTNNPHPITPEFVKVLTQVESEENARATSSSGARGLMQLMPETWEEQTRKIYGKSLPFSDAYDPEKNRRVGITYLINIHNCLSNELSGYSKLPISEQQQKIAAAYNGGQTRLVRNAGKIENMPRQTRRYVKKISRRLVAYNS